MKLIGAHVSASGGVENAPYNASLIGAKSFALFTKNQRQWEAKDLTDSNISIFRERMNNYGYKPEHVLPHGSYLLNLGNPDNDKREKSVNSLIKELERCKLLGLDRLNIHPGSHLGGYSEDMCLNKISESINKVLSNTTCVTLVLENTAGQGSNMGYKFEHIGKLIELTEDKSRIGFCLDTCHAFSAGYDFRIYDQYRKTVDTIEELIGFKYLKGVHLNDSKTELGSKKDRHHSIGEGFLGLDAFRYIMQDERFDNVPMVLETIDESIWAQEIKLLYSFI